MSEQNSRLRQGSGGQATPEEKKNLKIEIQVLALLKILRKN